MKFLTRLSAPIHLPKDSNGYNITSRDDKGNFLCVVRRDFSLEVACMVSNQNESGRRPSIDGGRCGHRERRG